MTVAASLDPLYPLKARFPVSPLILELVEIDIYQYMLCVNGKTATFRHLQARIEKVDRFGKRWLIIMGAFFALMLALELVGFILGWLCRFRTAGQAQATGGGGEIADANQNQNQNQNPDEDNRANYALANPDQGTDAQRN